MTVARSDPFDQSTRGEVLEHGTVAVQQDDRRLARTVLDIAEPHTPDIDELHRKR
jgi:hypothetical protein